MRNMIIVITMDDIKSAADNLKDYVFRTTKRNPMILPIIMEI